MKGERQDLTDINEKIMQLLKIDLSQQWIVLNCWLEQLNKNNAPEKLIRAFSGLFDEDIA